MKLLFQESSSFLSGNCKFSMLLEALLCQRFSSSVLPEGRRGHSRSRSPGAGHRADLAAEGRSASAPPADGSICADQVPGSELFTGQAHNENTRFSENSISLVFKRFHDNYCNL